jgi:hypothetical protein
MANLQSRISILSFLSLMLFSSTAMSDPAPRACVIKDSVKVTCNKADISTNVDWSEKKCTISKIVIQPNGDEVYDTEEVRVSGSLPMSCSNSVDRAFDYGFALANAVNDKVQAISLKACDQSRIAAAFKRRAEKASNNSSVIYNEPSKGPSSANSAD